MEKEESEPNSCRGVRSVQISAIMNNAALSSASKIKQTEVSGESTRWLMEESGRGAGAKPRGCSSKVRGGRGVWRVFLFVVE